MQMTTKQGIYLLVDDLLFILTADYFPMQGMFCHILIKIPLQSVPTHKVVSCIPRHERNSNSQL
jgi:cytochrome c oxidase subunit IV